MECIWYFLKNARMLSGHSVSGQTPRDASWFTRWLKVARGNTRWWVGKKWEYKRKTIYNWGMHSQRFPRAIRWHIDPRVLGTMIKPQETLADCLRHGAQVGGNFPGGFMCQEVIPIEVLMICKKGYLQLKYALQKVPKGTGFWEPNILIDASWLVETWGAGGLAGGGAPGVWKKWRSSPGGE